MWFHCFHAENMWQAPFSAKRRSQYQIQLNSAWSDEEIPTRADNVGPVVGVIEFNVALCRAGDAFNGSIGSWSCYSGLVDMRRSQVRIVSCLCAVKKEFLTLEGLTKTRDSIAFMLKICDRRLFLPRDAHKIRFSLILLGRMMKSQPALIM